MARANRNVYGRPFRKLISPAARNNHPPKASAAATTIGTPPILGTGREWELRSLGTSIIPTRSAMRMETHTPVAETAMDAAARPSVSGPNPCTTGVVPTIPFSRVVFSIHRCLQFARFFDRFLVESIGNLKFVAPHPYPPDQVQKSRESPQLRLYNTWQNPMQWLESFVYRVVEPRIFLLDLTLGKLRKIQDSAESFHSLLPEPIAQQTTVLAKRMEQRSRVGIKNRSVMPIRATNPVHTDGQLEVGNRLTGNADEVEQGNP